ncbi:hypothetical protein GCM10022213_17740 [Parerythrobacter jejuensis]
MAVDTKAPKVAVIKREEVAKAPSKGPDRKTMGNALPANVRNDLAWSIIPLSWAGKAIRWTVTLPICSHSGASAMASLYLFGWVVTTTAVIPSGMRSFKAATNAPHRNEPAHKSGGK